MRQLTFILIYIVILVVLFLNNTNVFADNFNWQCNSEIGLTKPAPVCSKEYPCEDLLGTYRFLKPPVYKIESASQGEPLCGTTSRGKRVGRPVYNDGPAKSILTTNDHMKRYYCEYDPQTVTVDRPLPLVIFVHGSGGYGDSMYDTTSLRKKASDYNLTDDPSRNGFVLVALQSRNLHWPTKDPQDGAKFDSYHRDFTTNPDVEYLDKVIDKAVASGIVDPERIYLMGWSNGARFTAFYGITRHHKSTPEGNKIAAIANFSGGDPYQNIQKGFKPGCQMETYPASTVPFYMISRSCDGVVCDEQQAQMIKKLTPGNVAGTWVDTLRTKVKNPNVQWQLINYYSKSVDKCALSIFCNPFVALRNHIFWPDGVEDKTGKDWEGAMLDFLKAHPLSE